MKDFMEMVSRIALLFIPGVIFLLFGRRLFWLVGGLTVGVIAMGVLSYFLQPDIVNLRLSERGFSFTFEEVPNLPSILIGALIAFVIGIVLTLRFPRPACGLVGFAGGALIVFGIFELYAVSLPEPVRRTLLLLGGIAVAFIGIRNQNQTMILLTTLLGAGLILQGLQLNWNEPIVAIIWLVLMLTGIIFQTNALRLEQLKATAARTASATAQ